MFNKSIFAVLFLFSLAGFSQEAKSPYKIEIDLTATSGDQIPVVIYPPETEADTVEYHMAKVVPGTYSISDFGRFVTDFQATDSAGNELATERISTNRWKISSGGKLDKISYKVHDTFESFEEYGKESNVIFEPGGTNIEKERDVYVINTFGFIGYIDGYKFHPYELRILHPEDIYGASALKKPVSTATEDVFVAEDFNFLADGPIMYSEPDTISRQIANAKVIVSVFSPNDVLSAKEVMNNITGLMEAQAEYLGGKLPVDRYAYLIYLLDYPSLSGSFGALEHSYSSLYTLPEAGAEMLAQTIKDVASHEFFHIVTPLNIHSEEIGNFDYIDPEMSKHLWLYEGVTEYSSMHVQVKYGIYGPETFLDEIQEKLRVADNFPNVSFTEMSEHILEPEYEPMYANVYYKGALIGMCLDLYLLKYSDQQYDLQMLMRDLATKYGKQKSFEDDELFDVIEELTYPEIGEFLRTYVAGDEPLPIKEVLSWAGIEYNDSIEVEDITLGRIGIGLTENDEVKINDVSNMNEFGKEMGYQEGDILVSLNKQEISLVTVQQVLEEFSNTTAPGDKVVMVVKREVKPGKVKKKKLKARAMTIKKTLKHHLEFMQNTTVEQNQMLEAWILSKE